MQLYGQFYYIFESVEVDISFDFFLFGFCQFWIVLCPHQPLRCLNWLSSCVPVVINFFLLYVLLTFSWHGIVLVCSVYNIDSTIQWICCYLTVLKLKELMFISIIMYTSLHVLHSRHYGVLFFLFMLRWCTEKSTLYMNWY